MDTVSPKVTAASGAAGGSMPLAIIIVWLLGEAGIQVPPEIGAAIASLVSAVAAFLAGYFVRHQPTAAVVIASSPPGTTAADLNREELARHQGNPP